MELMKNCLSTMLTELISALNSSTFIVCDEFILLMFFSNSFLKLEKLLLINEDSLFRMVKNYLNYNVSLN